MRLQTASYQRDNPAGEALVGFGPAAVKPVVAATRSPYALVRRRSAWTLGELRDPAATKPLEALTKDPSPEARQAAKEALARLRETPTASAPSSEPSLSKDQNGR